MEWGLWHCRGDRDQDHPHGKEMQKSKMAAWGGLTNSCERDRTEWLIWSDLIWKIFLHCSVTKSCPIICDPIKCSAMFPCLSQSPRVCSSSCPLRHWCQSTISSSVAPFSCPHSFPPSEYLPMSQLFTSGGQSIGASVSAPVLPMNIQGWFPQDWLVWSNWSNQSI